MLARALVGITIGVVVRLFWYSCEKRSTEGYVVRGTAVVISLIFIGVSASYGSVFGAMAIGEILLGYGALSGLAAFIQDTRKVFNVFTRPISAVFSLFASICSFLESGAKVLNELAIDVEKDAAKLANEARIARQNKLAELTKQLKEIDNKK